MPDDQQNKPTRTQYRYSIPQLLELSNTAWPVFDLSKFTYEAARAGVVPSLDGCTMSSRKSSASHNRAANIEATASPDVILFHGGRTLQPGRQPKLPPPTERQKDEGFAKFLKKHSSPTHNRVTAGGRIVPMEPRSPPTFSLSSNATHRPQSNTGDQEFRNAKRNGYNTDIQASPALQRNENLENDRGPATKHMAGPTQHTEEFSNNLVSAAFPQHATNGIIPAHIGSSYPPAPMLTPIRAYVPGQHIETPVMPQVLLGQPAACNAYNSPPTVGSALPLSSEMVVPSWPIYEPNFAPQDPMNQMMSVYQFLAAWEQHYLDLDMQLKNIDRHRAMHHLDPYLAEQRKVIVQQRSDAKDFVKEYQTMLGIRKAVDSSQDSVATSFNVDAPAYVPAIAMDTNDFVSRDGRTDPAQSNSDMLKSKTNSTRRAIPIVPPPEKGNEAVVTQQAKTESVDAQNISDFDEWGIQNRPAPPEVQREQSRLSDMLQAEQQRLSSSRSDSSQYMSTNQPSDQSQQGVPTDSFSDDAEANADLVHTCSIQSAPETIPRDNADEMQQVMDAISKPKGTVTPVRLLDNRVINVEGQGLELSSITVPRKSSQQGWLKGDARNINSSLSRNMKLGEAYTHVVNGDHVGVKHGSLGKENVLIAPKGHQKAATDAFLAQFNAVEDNVASAVRPETRSLRTTSNGQVEGQKYPGIQPNIAINFPPCNVITGKLNGMDIGAGQGPATYPTMDRNKSDFQTAALVFPDTLNNKGYSSVSVQNINVVGHLPQNLDGTADARQIAQAQLAAAEKARSPRLLRRHGINGEAWYGPYCREVSERARLQYNGGRAGKPDVS